MFKRITYPDGQISAKVEEFPQRITARTNSYEDLMFLRSIGQVYKLYGKTAILFLPCLFGQRSDRRFESQQSFDLQLICNDINSCGFSKVLILDPHSDVSLALINNSEKISSYSFVEKAIADIRTTDRANTASTPNLILVSPDAGAYKKVFDYGQKLESEVVAAVKHRDLKGNVDLTFMGDVKDKDCLIVDDLCDGGYTFEVLGKKLKEQGAKRVYLYVSHGYFSKGFLKLAEVIDHIYCTNSVKDLEKTQNTHPDIKDDRWMTDYVTQFKVL